MGESIGSVETRQHTNTIGSVRTGEARALFSCLSLALSSVTKLIRHCRANHWP